MALMVGVASVTDIMPPRTAMMFATTSAFKAIQFENSRSGSPYQDKYLPREVSRLSEVVH